MSLAARRFTIFPLVFYRSSRVLGAEFAILPSYADRHDFFGYQRFRAFVFFGTLVMTLF